VEAWAFSKERLNRVSTSESSHVLKRLLRSSHISFIIQNFLTLAVGSAVGPEKIRGGAEANVVFVDGEKHYRKIEIVYQSTASRRGLESVNPYFMLFRFANVRDRIHLLLNNWFNKTDSLRPVYDLFFAALYNPDEYLHSKFLSYVQAIETYHRRTKTDYLIPEEQHRERIEEILKTVPENCRAWLERELEYSNRPRLRRRLKELLIEFPWLLGENSSRKDINAFVNTVVTTRNYLTHYNELLEEQAAKDEGLYEITLKMQSLLRICLLKEMGLGLDEIKALVEKRNRHLPW
jgi:ApeA N-terminal domain 1